MQPDPKDQAPLVKTILQQLLDSGQLDGPAAGIARQVIARGETTLSERQEWVFDAHVRSKYLLRVCDLCGDLIALSEVMPSLNNGGLCGTCALIMDKQGEQG
jgi:hypothetical protein